MKLSPPSHDDYRRSLSRAIKSRRPRRRLLAALRGDHWHQSMVPRRMQVAFAAGSLIFAGWVVYTALFYFSFDWIVREKNHQIADARIAYRDVLDQIAIYNSRLAEMDRALEKRQGELRALFNPKGGNHARTGAAGKGKRYTQLAEVFDDGSRGSYVPQIRELERQRQALARRNPRIAEGVVRVKHDVARILAEHDDVIRQQKKLRIRVRRFDTAVAALRAREDEYLSTLAVRASDAVSRAEHLIARTGLEPNRLLAALPRAGTTGQGGPFIAAGSAADMRALERKVGKIGTRAIRWQRLRRVMDRLPLATPLKRYWIASVFGRRKDPVNGRWAQHNGIDIVHNLGSDVFSAGPGRVVYAGWRGGFGRVIEIDHGMGVRSRYAHLKKILVQNGQKVVRGTAIGLLGNTGRSTGPHVHYEVLVNGKPTNPMNFIEAGRYVQQN